jgi:fucose permease
MLDSSQCILIPVNCPTLQIPEYIQIVGIICGMITIGYLGDKIGRKWGSVCTVSLMCVGAILLTVQNAPTDQGQVIFCESLLQTGPYC